MMQSQRSSVWIDYLGISKLLEYLLIRQNNPINQEHSALCLQSGFGDLDSETQQELVRSILEQHFAGESVFAVDIFCQSKDQQGWHQFHIGYRFDSDFFNKSIAVLNQMPTIGEYDIFIADSKPLQRQLSDRLNHLLA